MLKQYILLINFFLAFNANANEINENEINYDFSGFITATHFSNNAWHDDISKTALNFDITYNTYAVRGQIHKPGEHFLRRFTVEKDIYLNEQHDIILKAGIFPRLDSFYNNVTDAPSTSALALLPLGEYNHRMINNSTFSGLKGISLYYNYVTDVNQLNVHLDIGSANIENHCDIHAEAFGTPCTYGYKFKSNNKNYSIGGTFNHGDFTYLAHISQFNINTELVNPEDKVASKITRDTEDISLRFIKFGLKYEKNKCWVQSELVFSDSSFKSPNKENVNFYRSKNAYILSGYNWSDQLSTHVVYSVGKDTGNNIIKDKGVGITYVYKNTTLSTEYHVGKGKEWAKFYSPIDKWNSWVFTLTQRF